MANPSIVPKEALAFFQNKGLKPTKHWTELWQGEHARNFTVARSVYGDILNDVYKELEQAIGRGETLQTFQKNLTPVLQAKGWWGKATDGTQLGSPRRLRTIYDTNMRTAYAAGRWERIQSRKEFMPYLLYVCVLDEKTRTEHRQWHYLCLPVDDSFWATHYPPNGWHCRCTVRQLSREDVERLGLVVSQSPSITYREWVNQATGEHRQVPIGIAPGFDYNVGMASLEVQTHAQFADKLKTFEPGIASVTLEEVVKSDDFVKFFNNPQGIFPVGVMNELTKQALKAQTAISIAKAENLSGLKKLQPGLQASDGAAINQTLQDYDYLLQTSTGSVLAIKKVQPGNLWHLVKLRRDGSEVTSSIYRLYQADQIQKLIQSTHSLK